MIFCKMRYDQDENGKEILLKEDTFQVMMEWEKPYMQACIDELQPFGDVLESQQYLEKIEKESQESSLIVKQAELLIKEINQQFPSLSTQKYSDQDLNDFVKTVASEPEEQLITFLQQLYSNKQITKQQFE